jgi:hypothetical protein
MKIMFVLLAAAGLSCAQAVGPWASIADAPRWWLQVHLASLAIPEQVMAEAAIAEPMPTVSFSPQGAKVLETLTGKRISGVGIHDLVICSPLDLPVRAGSVYQLAVAQGISPLSPALATALFRSTVNRNWRNIALDIGADASVGIPVLGQAGIISMSAKWVTALLSGHFVFDSMKARLTSHLPDPTPVLGSLLDPGSVLTFMGSCREAMMITRYGRKDVSGTFLLSPR